MTEEIIDIHISEINKHPKHVNKGKEKSSPRNILVKFKTLKRNQNILKVLDRNLHHLEAKISTPSYVPIKTEDSGIVCMYILSILGTKKKHSADQVGRLEGRRQ